MAWSWVELYFVGGANGIALILQDITKDLRSKLYSLLGIDTTRRGWKLFSGLVTFVIIDFTWVFFRAPDFYSALQILGKIVEDFRFSYLFTVAFFQMFGSTYQFVVIVCSLIVVFLVDWLKHKGIDYRECIFRQQIVFRWIIYIFVISIILIWGCYGDGYEQTQFIYFQF